MQAGFDLEREEHVGQTQAKCDPKKRKGKKVYDPDVEQCPSDQKGENDKEQDGKFSFFYASEMVVFDQIYLFQKA
jgi:hypothetical protein